MTKKISILIMALMLILCLISAGCTKTSPAPTPSPATDTEKISPSGPTPENPLELKFSYHAPPQAGLSKVILAPWAEEIEKASGGTVKITQYPGGTLVTAEDAYDAVATGLCDIAQVETEEAGGRFPLSGINALPFLYPNTEIAGAISHELLNKYCIDTELKEIKLLITAPLHMSHYLGNKQINKKEDFKGVKIVAAGKVEANTITALGGTPIQVSTGEVFTALDKGTIDGCFYAYEGALAFGLKDVTKYRTECGIFPRIFILAMNMDTYNNMPSDIKKIFDEYSTVETSRRFSSIYMAAEEGAKGAIIGSDQKAGNPSIYVLPEEERASWKSSCQPVWDEWVTNTKSKSLPGEEMLAEAQKLISQELQSK